MLGIHETTCGRVGGWGRGAMEVERRRVAAVVEEESGGGGGGEEVGGWWEVVKDRSGGGGAEGRCVVWGRFTSTACR